MTATDDDRVARAALERFGFARDVELRLINLSENATYSVADGDTTSILRVHREAYHSVAAIESELAWIDALASSPVATATPLRTPDGARVVTVPTDGGERHAVLFEYLEGTSPDSDALTPEQFRRLGAVTARLHEHARDWSPPAGFSRFTWDWTTMLGAQARWGSWEDGVGLTDEHRSTIGQAAALVHDRLSRYGNGPDRFGLVHADLRLANLIVNGDQVTVIDFDDAGYSWFLYDFGTAVSFVEEDPRLPEWQSAWVDGYRECAVLTEEDVAMLPTFVMLRRLLLVAWIGSHQHSREARVLGEAYSAGTARLAERYLRGHGESTNRRRGQA